MNNYNKVINLLNQIIEYNTYKDLLEKDPTETGDNWNLYHLKILRDLIKENEK